MAYWIVQPAMRWLSEWRRGPVATLIVAWLACSGTVLTLYLVAEARSTERMYREMGFRLGATESEFHVDWLSMWPQILGLYVVIVALPPALFLLLWRRARRTARPTA